MEKVHFDAGFIGTNIRALAQRGAQNSCPGAIWKVLSRCFLLARPEGGEFGSQLLCQGTFAYKIRVICKGPNNFAYKIRVICEGLNNDSHRNLQDPQRTPKGPLRTPKGPHRTRQDPQMTPRDPQGIPKGPQRPCQSTFACNIRVICYGACNSPYKIRLLCCGACNSPDNWLSLLKQH